MTLFLNSAKMMKHVLFVVDAMKIFANILQKEKNANIDTNIAKKIVA
jgi:hypothetical protein